MYLRAKGLLPLSPFISSISFNHNFTCKITAIFLKSDVRHPLLSVADEKTIGY